MPNIRLLLERLGLILFGLSLAIVSLELVLRLGSLFFGPRLEQRSVEAPEHTILCLGDSHTYGVFYTPAEAYPGQLQSQLDRRAPNHYRVVNLGVPGMNSSQIRSGLPGWFDEYGPDTIIVGSGLNNVWNTSSTGQSEDSGFLVRAFRGLRVYRFYRLLVAAAGDARSEALSFTERPELRRVQGEGGTDHYDVHTGEIVARNSGDPTSRLTPAHASDMLWTDLEAMRRLTKERGARMILLTYSAFPLPGRPLRFTTHQLLNDTMRRFSSQHQIELVDVRERVLSLVPIGVPRTEFFASEKDGHPNPRGYSEIAGLVAGVVTESGSPQPPIRATSSEPGMVEKPRNSVDMEYTLAIEPSGFGEVTITADGRAMRVVSGAFRGGLGAAESKGGRVRFTGWAADIKNKEVPQAIVIFSHEEVIHAGSTRLPRQRIVDLYDRESLLLSGFDFTIPTDVLGDPSSSEVRFFAISERGFASELKYFVGYPWINKYSLGSDGSVAEFLRATDGEEIPVVPGSLEGKLEPIKVEGRLVHFRGWAADPKNHEVPAMIVVFADGEFFHASQSDVARRRSAIEYGSDAVLYSGFHFTAPISVVGEGSNFRAFAVSRKMFAAELKQ